MGSYQSSSSRRCNDLCLHGAPLLTLSSASTYPNTCSIYKRIIFLQGYLARGTFSARCECAQVVCLVFCVLKLHLYVLLASFGHVVRSAVLWCPCSWIENYSGIALVNPAVPNSFRDVLKVSQSEICSVHSLLQGTFLTRWLDGSSEASVPWLHVLHRFPKSRSWRAVSQF